jgi:Flp pilus assembly protein TadG
MATITSDLITARRTSPGARRRGVIVPLFAIVLPALLLLCCVALNIAQFRMLRTELRVATDASAHAAGRAMSVYQDVDKTIAFAKQVAAMNTVANKPVELTDEQIYFGRSTRKDVNSRYAFTPVSTEDVRSKNVIPNSIGVKAFGDYPVLLPAISGRNTIPLEEKSVATQVDRDVILVLDKSGSMMTYKNDEDLDDVLYSLYKAGKIKKSEYEDARDDDDFSSNVVKKLSGDMKEYATDRRASSSEAPRHSRWDQLEKGVDAFFEVIEATDQTEYVGLVLFSSSASLDQKLMSSYSPIKSSVAKVKPSGNTAIGYGMNEGVPELFTSSRARPYATKTIVVLTDGIHNTGTDPVKVAKDIKKKYSVTIHSVTFSNEADIERMKEVAEIGGGKHYHSEDGDDLVPIFREIANNLPTILTQ